ncbi:MAG: radical SAM protein [Oscillospiraceae bacterium]
MALIPIVENKKKSLGIYVHIPFCRSKCEYCDFYSIPGARSRDLMDRYLDAVILHIREAAQGAAGYEVDTVYFGGGTPSFFGAGGLAKIFAEIDRRFDVSRDAEVSLEANPDSVTLPMLHAAAPRGLQPHLHRRAVGRRRPAQGPRPPAQLPAGAAGRLALASRGL